MSDFRQSYCVFLYDVKKYRHMTAKYENLNCIEVILLKENEINKPGT